MAVKYNPNTITPLQTKNTERTMKIQSVLALATALINLEGIVAPSPSSSGVFQTTETVVMREGEVWPEQQARRYHNNRCEVRLQWDGNFVVKRMIAPNPWYQQLRVAWSTGTSRKYSSGYYHAELQDDGSLAVILKHPVNGTETQVYTNNIGEPQALEDYNLERTHKLVISEECVLSTYRGDKEVWTNNRFGGLVGYAGLSDYLQKGEMFYLKQCYECGDHPDCIWSEQALMLQHDCNLVHFAGRDQADLKENRVILWTSGTPRPDLEDCYLYSDADKVRLYEGKLDKSLPQFAPRAGASYWEADDDFKPECSPYEVLLRVDGGLQPSC